MIVPDNFRFYPLNKNNLNGATKVNESLLEDLNKKISKIHGIGIDKNFFRSIYAICGKRENRKKFLVSEKILISVPGHSGFLAFFLSKLCSKEVFFIAHNAEFLHRVEWAQNSKGLIRKFKFRYRAVKGIVADFLVVNSAKKILVLGELEIDEYWKKLGRRGNIKNVTHFPYIPPNRVKNSKKQKHRKYIALIGSHAKPVGENRVSVDFMESIKHIKNEVNKNGYLLVAFGNGITLDVCDENWGFLDDKEYLKRFGYVEAIIVPQDWGWGFKTKIADSLYNNQRVFVSDKIAARYRSLEYGLEVVTNWSLFRIKKLNKLRKESVNELLLNQQKKREQILHEICN
jgi:hypothetical protein